MLASWLSIVLVIPSAKLGPFASRSASSCAVARAACASATTRLNSPICSAAGASTGSPSIRISVARPRPTTCGSSHAAPMSAPASPTRTNRNAILAVSTATRRSQASAITAPAPAATPLMPATTGFGSARMLPISSPVMRVNCSSSGAFSSSSGPMISVTLPPLQKPRPSPVMTTARTSRSSRRARRVSVSSR